MQHIDCSWLVKRKDPGLGSDLLSISQIGSRRRGKRFHIPTKLKEKAEAICRSVSSHEIKEAGEKIGIAFRLNNRTKQVF